MNFINHVGFWNIAPNGDGFYILVKRLIFVSLLKPFGKVCDDMLNLPEDTTKAKSISIFSSLFLDPIERENSSISNCSPLSFTMAMF